MNPWLGGALSEPECASGLGRAIVLLFVLLFGALVGSIVSHYARRARRPRARWTGLLGAVFGLLRGVLVVGLLVLGGPQPSTSTLEPWWERTNSMPAAEAVASWIERYAQPAAAELYDQATAPPGT